jgi:hypothetical protein
MESTINRCRTAPVAVLAALLALLCAWVSPALGASPRPYAKLVPACGPPAQGEATCFAIGRVPVPAADAARPGVRRVPSSPAALTLGPAGGLTPALLASAYGYDPNAGGTGETVAVVDAFDDPNIESDLASFSTQYGLPSCTAGTGCFRKVGQTGSGSELPPADTKAWSVEISLDVEMVHAACPKCRILLVEANNALLANLGAAVSKAAELGALAVTNSYGGPEQVALGAPERTLFEHPGVAITAATGDFGYDWWTGGIPDPETPDAPASMPGVVSVGGTTLTLNGEGKRAQETVWNGNGVENEGEFKSGVSGGGCSIFFESPLWQRDAAGFAATGCGAKRLSADVAAVADPLTGFDIFDTYNCGAECEKLKGSSNWSTIGGTSVSAPLIASLYTLAGGADGLAYPAATLYAHLGSGSLFDVTKGSDGYCNNGGAACGVNAFYGERLDCEGTTACNATSGFDGASGVGAPASLSLFEPLLPKAVITPPAKAFAGSPATFSGSSSTDSYPGATRAYSWTFGDGQAGSGASVAHTYAAAGEYTVSLQVGDSYGLQSAPVTTKVLVTEPSKLEEEEAKKARELKEKEEAAKKAREAKEKKKRPRKPAKPKKKKKRRTKPAKPKKKKKRHAKRGKPKNGKGRWHRKPAASMKKPRPA